MDVNSCRICLLSDLCEMKSIFDVVSSQDYAEKITFISGIYIDPEEPQLPQRICIDCINQVESASVIKNKCLNSDKILRRKVKDELFQYSKDKSTTIDNLVEACKTEDLNIVLEQNEEYFDVSSFKSESEPSEKSVKTRKTRTRKKPPKPQRNKNKKPEEHDYRCFICQKVFDLISVKDLHVKQHHSDVRLCHICSQKKQTSMALETHLRYHFFGHRFLCSTCGKSFRFRNLLENHLKLEHYNSVKFKCDLCHYETKFKINLERHVKSVHMKLKNFKCEKCVDREYSTQVGLNLHLYRVHNVEAPVSCGGCSQGFTFESELRVHKKHCTGSSVRIQKARPQDALVDILESGFRCRVCLQIYETRSKWSVHFHHKHKHSNVCTICQKQMSSSTSLFKHIQVQHNNIKKFQCQICLKTFGFKHSLESHQNTHTGDKPFSCNLCNFKSGDRSTISKHKKKIHAQ